MVKGQLVTFVVPLHAKTGERIRPTPRSPMMLSKPKVVIPNPEQQQRKARAELVRKSQTQQDLLREIGVMRKQPDPSVLIAKFNKSPSPVKAPPENRRTRVGLPAKSADPEIEPHRESFIKYKKVLKLQRRQQHSAWRESLGMKAYYDPPPLPPLPDPMQAAAWIFGVPLLTSIWVHWCAYSWFTVIFSYLSTMLIALGYLVAPIPVDDEEDADDEEEETVTAGNAEEKKAEMVPLHIQKNISIGVQLSMGFCAIFTIIAMITDPAATYAGAISTFLLAMVGFFDTAEYLKTWIEPEQLEKFNADVESGYGKIETFVTPVMTRMQPCVSACAAGCITALTICLNLIRALAEWLRTRVQSCIGADTCGGGLDSGLSYIAFESASRHDELQQLQSSDSDQLGSLMQTFADGFENSSGSAGEGLRNGMHNLLEVLADPKQRQAILPPWLITFSRRHLPSLHVLLTGKTRQLKAVYGAVKPRETRIQKLKRQLGDWWEPKSKDFKKGFIAYLNDIGYAARQSPIKIFMSFLDLYGLVELMYFLAGHMKAAVHGNAGAGLYWFTHSVQASVVGVALTFASSTDFVRRFTRPEEYERGLREEEARYAVLRERKAVERLLKDALKEPTSVKELQTALMVAQNGGNQVTAGLLQQAKEALEAAKERDSTIPAQREQTARVLTRFMKADPYIVDEKTFESKIEVARTLEVAGRLLNKAEMKLVEVRRVRREQKEALRGLLTACGEEVRDDTSFKTLMEIDLTKLEKRISPAVRKGNRAVVDLWTKMHTAQKVFKGADGVTLSPQVRTPTSEAHQTKLVAIRGPPKPITIESTVVVPLLEQAIENARELRVPKVARDAAMLILEDARYVQLALADPVSRFVMRIRWRVQARKTLNAASRKLETARTDTKIALEKLQLTRQHTILLRGAIKDLGAACKNARGADVEEWLVELAEEELESNVSMLRAREDARVSVEEAHRDGMAMMANPRKSTQHAIEHLSQRLETAILEANELYVKFDQDAFYDVHDQLVSLHAKRRNAMRKIVELMDVVERTSDEIIGVDGQPVVFQLRSAFEAAEAARVQEDSWVQEQYVAFFVGRYPFARIKVETTRCEAVLQQFATGTRSRLPSYSYQSGTVVMKETVDFAMAPMLVARDQVQNALNHAVGMGSMQQALQSDAVSRANEVMARTEKAHKRFVEAHHSLEGAKISVETTKRNRLGHRQAFVKAAHHFMHIMVKMMAMTDPEVPQVVITDGREAIRPLYHPMMDAMGYHMQAPVLTEHRYQVLQEHEPGHR